MEQGTLKLPVNKLPMQGVIQTWRQACGKCDVWNGSRNATNIAEEKLKSIFCPECREEHDAKGMKLKVNFGFSNLTHQTCREVATTASWRCKRELLWYKCGLHKHEPTWKIDKGKGKNVGKGKHFNPDLGIDHPMPVSRKRISCSEVACIGMQPLANKRLR